MVGRHKVEDLGPGILCSLSVPPLWVRRRQGMQCAAAQGGKSPLASSHAAQGRLHVRSLQGTTRAAQLRNLPR